MSASELGFGGISGVAVEAWGILRGAHRPTAAVYALGVVRVQFTHRCNNHRRAPIVGIPASESKGCARVLDNGRRDHLAIR